MTSAVLESLDARTYTRHALHRTERAWVETNCYADLWIEILHALGLDPMPSMAYALAIDFEGDQWTFFKPLHSDLYALYGIDVQELNLWHTLEAHAIEQVGRGRIVLAEVDAWFLPDTHGTDYKAKHTKTAIGINRLQPEAGRMGYFHNAGYFELGPEDYAGVCRRTALPDGTLPPYVEFAKVSELRSASRESLASQSLVLLNQHLRRAPKSNPIVPFGVRFGEDVERLKSGALPDYHVYAFATVRQLGAAFELSAHYLQWLTRQGQIDLAGVIADFELISSTAKAMILKTARAVTTKKPVDFASMLSTMAAAWDTGIGKLRSRYGG